MPLAVHLEALAGVEVLGLGFPFGGSRIMMARVQRKVGAE